MEDIRLLVQEEGRTARNLIAFNVPVVETQYDQGKAMRKPPTSPRTHLEIRQEEAVRLSKRACESSQTGPRVRSASTGRDKKSELHARYWAFLFGNLQRAVDEIYQTCESDESVTECKEVIMVLDNYTREFRNLIDWFKIKWEYENTPPPQRPRSLAWEIRKSSPGKIRPVLLVEPAINETSKNDSVSSAIMFKSNNSKCDELLVPVKEMKTGEKKSETKTEEKSPQKTNEEEFVSGSTLQGDNDCKKEDTWFDDNPDNKHDLSCDLVNDSSYVSTEKEVLVMLSKNECDLVMVDSVCQTDREEDVDENGPKYRNSGQQTCSSISDIDQNSSMVNAADKSYSKTVSEKISTHCNNLKEKSVVTSGVDVSKENNANTIISKSTSVANTKISSSSGFTSPKPSVRNSFSFIAANQNKSKCAQNNAKTIASGRSVKYDGSSVIRKVSSTLIDRQPWGARPLSSISSKQSGSGYNSSFSPLNKWVRNRTVPEMRKISDFSEKSKAYRSSHISNEGSNTKLNQIREIKSSEESSTSIKNSEVSSSSMHEGVASSVKSPIDGKKGQEEDDGWVKVKSRNRFSPSTKTEGLETTLSRSTCSLKIKMSGNAKMTPKTRFNQPSSAVSLPTLSLLDGDSKENITEESYRENETSKKANRLKIESKSKTKENQKSVRKTEKNLSKISDLNNKLRSSDKSSKKNFNSLNDKKSNAHTDANHLLTERIKNTKNNKMGNFERKKLLIEQEGIDDDENQFDEEIKKNKETEEMLQKEIHELQAAEIEIDIETGDEETDCETITGTEEESDSTVRVENLILEDDWKREQKKKSDYKNILSGMSWADHQDALNELERLVAQDCSSKGMTKDEERDTLERLEELVARHPGRALELHQKLSSPSRRRTIPDTVKRFQARQAKASEKREQLKMEKAQKLRELLKKVDEVKAAKDKLIEDRRQRLEMKLKRAAENRNLHLKEIMRKAHDEEEKLKEIAFINELEAQNKRHDFMTQCQEQEDRLQGIHEERQRKQEEKAAKEAAVEERRKALEAERQVKLEKMQERQRKRDEQADKKKQEKEKERQELAREKARDRSERLEALHAAQLEAQEELQKKIQQKQEEYARRHEENIEQIRQKALELSILKCADDIAPKLAPYETQKICNACNVLIASEVYLLSHLRGRKHQEAVKNQNNGKDMTKEEIERYNIKVIVNAPADKIDSKMMLDRERAKSLKKKFKKIRLRMNAKGEEYEAKIGNEKMPDSQNKVKLKKCLKDITRIIDIQGKGRWSENAVTALERAMGEIRRTFDKEDLQDKEIFRILHGFHILCDILQLDIDVTQDMMPFLPQKCFVTVCTTFLAAVTNSVSNSKYIIASNKIAYLMDLLLKHLVVLIPDNAHRSSSCIASSSLPVDPIAIAVMRVITKILSSQEANCDDAEDHLQRLQDVVSYTVSVGIVDKLSRYWKTVRDPIDDDLSGAQFLLSAVEFLTTLTSVCKMVRKGNEDRTQLLATLQATELIGAISILYGMLLHQNSPSRLTDPVPPALPSHTVSVALATIRLLRSVAELDLQIFQSILGAEGISLQFRHIASYLLWYCSQDREKNLLHEVIAVVGFFAVQNRDNQMILQSGSMPTVLQQLCNLPFPYFSNPELSSLLYPTLLACCYGNEENKAILEQEITYSLLEDFMESDSSGSHPLLALFNKRDEVRTKVGAEASDGPGSPEHPLGVNGRRKKGKREGEPKKASHIY